MHRIVAALLVYQVYHRKPAYWVSDFKQPEGHDYGQTKEIMCVRASAPRLVASAPQ
jgi:hypothetical protein